MASLAWRLRVYWKRYTFAAVASVLVARYAAKKFRDNNIVRAYCQQAKKYGEERVGPVERDGKPGSAKKVMVFLNPTANKRESKLQFLKYSAPLFFLSGVDVTVIESQREGHLRTLMNYIDPRTDCIVVAGGDGTLMEVFTGLMRRTDAEKFRSIPIGVIPLGRENRFYQSNLSSTGFKSPTRRIGDATMDIIRGDQTTPVHLIEIKPESGRLLYALSSVQWGPLRDAYENRDGFRLLGKLRLFFSHFNVALRRWPTDYVLHLWYPRHCQLEEDSGAHPPSSITSITADQAQSASQSNTTSSTTRNTQMNAASTTQRTESLFEKYLAPIKAHCIKPRYDDTRETSDEKKSSSSLPSVPGNFELTKLATETDLEYRELKVLGFHLSVQTGRGGNTEGGQEGGGEGGSVVLELNTWMDGSIRKTEFIKRGWLETLGRSPAPLPSLPLSSPHLVLQPFSHVGSWVSIDGEVYETMPISVTAVPYAFRAYSRKTA